MKSLRRSHTSTSSSANSSSTSLPSSSSSSTTSTSPPSANSSSWIHLRSVLFVANPSSPSSVTSSDRRRKSPWSRRKRKRPLTPHQWRSLFTPEGKLRDGGVRFLKRVRSRGVDPSIRAEVWLFLLGFYDLNSTIEEREAVKTQKRKEYEKLQRRCKMLLKGSDNLEEEVTSEEADDQCVRFTDDYKTTKQIINQDVVSAVNTDSSDTDSCEDDEDVHLLPSDVYSDETKQPEEENNHNNSPEDSTSPPPSVDSAEIQVEVAVHEDFSTWQRIIRLDALRADSDWATYSPSSTTITETKARALASSVALKDYDHLETCRLHHAARLVSILEAYALYDPEIGYCQGMSDLLSPILAVISEDHEAFWCFVGFMKKARHNFRLDEAGIQRQLRIISKIIKSKDSQLYKHLENLQAEDCSFVYRMVLVMFRRELSFEQTLCLWEVMWADQAAIRAGVGKSPWSRIRQHAPPTDDLLLYAIAALVLRRKLIIQRYSSMDEIVEECNSMAGQLDVWKLLDDAHHLVVTLHDKIETLSSQSLGV
ncbi:rab GTPase-activating protein 22 isoform X2 [Raphanus sativus]|uniref:Rab GTPase-activating protein 22 isoform X2 n=1 Tax=Raphanus sativus TaxID=3726 RepID=A0A6J0M384_RAPSA|nr:rab GTPase-activating protein 22 isoform X2 [Raphanus sativus]